METFKKYLEEEKQKGIDKLKIGDFGSEMEIEAVIETDPVIREYVKPWSVVFQDGSLSLILYSEDKKVKTHLLHNVWNEHKNITIGELKDLILNHKFEK